MNQREEPQVYGKEQKVPGSISLGRWPSLNGETALCTPLELRDAACCDGHRPPVFLWWNSSAPCLITAYGGFGWAENVYGLLAGVWRWVRSTEPCLHLIESDVTTLDLRSQPDAWIELEFTGLTRWVYFAMGAMWIIRQNVVNWYFDGLKWPTVHGIPSLVSPHRRWALPIGCKHTCRQWKHEIYVNIGTFLLEYSVLEPSHHAARKPKLVRWGCQWKREKSHIIPASHELPSHARKSYFKCYTPADTTWNRDEPYLPLLPKLKNCEHVNYCCYFKPFVSQ